MTDETQNTGSDDNKLAAAGVEQDPLEASIARVRAQRAAVAQRRIERGNATSKRDELEAEERALADESALESAELEFGEVGKKIYVVKTRLGDIILRQANPIKFKRFQDKESTTVDDLDVLVRPCVVYPTIAKFDDILKELPATLPRCANAIAVLAGVRIEEVRGK